MTDTIHVVNKECVDVSWEFNGKKIHIPFEGDGIGIYSEKYKLIVVMNMKAGIYSLDMKAYNLNGELRSPILPYGEEELSYGYISRSDRVKSGIVVIADYKNRKGDFYDWQFEVDLDEFKISNCIDRAY